MLYTISSGHIYFHNQKFAPSDHFTNFTSPPAPDSGNQPICSLQLRVWEKEMATHPLQYSCLENPMDGAAWQATVHGVTKSRTRLSDFTFTFHLHALEKEMATHSSVVGCRLWGCTESDTTEATQQQQQLRVQGFLFVLCFLFFRFHT